MTMRLSHSSLTGTERTLVAVGTVRLSVHTGLRALDDPVVVRRGQRHDLADRVAGQGLLGGALVLRRVVHRADADDRALALHQPRHGVVGADRARVGQADRGALEVA